MKNKTIDLGTTITCELDDFIIIGFSKKYLRLNDGRHIEFHVRINENGKVILESQTLTKFSNIGVDDDTKH
jgi:hypothetical protein